MSSLNALDTSDNAEELPDEIEGNHIASALTEEAGDVLPGNTAVEPTPAVANKVSTVSVLFTRVVRDAKGRIMPYGKATATYNTGAQIIVSATGGANVKTYGISDPVKNYPVTRIEGKNYKNHLGQPMPYATFYNRGEALHVGRLDLISHGCIHIGDEERMFRINRDCIKGKTKVTVAYAPGILNKVMKQIM